MYVTQASWPNWQIFPGNTIQEKYDIYIVSFACYSVKKILLLCTLIFNDSMKEAYNCAKILNIILLSNVSVLVLIFRRIPDSDLSLCLSADLWYHLTQIPPLLHTTYKQYDQQTVWQWQHSAKQQNNPRQYSEIRVETSCIKSQIHFTYGWELNLRWGLYLLLFFCDPTLSRLIRII